MRFYLAQSHAELRIALDIIERNTTCGNVVTPRRP
jgi:hypothetical protein